MGSFRELINLANLEDVCDNLEPTYKAEPMSVYDENSFGFSLEDMIEEELGY